METLDINALELWSVGDVAKYLGLSNGRTNVLIKSYKIPYASTSAGKIFLKSDILAFQKSRQHNMKHARK